MAKGENRMMRRRLANAYLSSVVSISLVLLLVGVASLLLVNTDNVSRYFKENMKVSVLMMPEVSDAQAMDYQAVLDSMPFIRGTEFISRAQGEQEMARMLGKDFLSVFETSPIPVSVDVTLAADYVSDDSLKVVSQRLSASPLVDEVVWQKSLVDALSANLARISLVLGVFIVLLLFVSFVLIGNTMRLSVYARRFTIHPGAVPAEFGGPGPFLGPGGNPAAGGPAVRAPEPLPATLHALPSGPPAHRDGHRRGFRRDHLRREHFHRRRAAGPPRQI